MKSLQFAPLAAVICSLCLVSPAAAIDKDKLEEALAEPVTMSFDQMSLEESLNVLVKRVAAIHDGFAIKIIYNDLQFEGLTRNQSIRNYEAKDKPAAEVLTELMQRGNSNRDVTDPRDPKQKLIWIVGANPDDADKLAILVTTRAAAKKRGDKLPKVFQLKE